jgi:hypothetical protein
VCVLLQNDVNDVIDHCVKKNRIDDAVFWYMLSTVLSTSQEVSNKDQLIANSRTFTALLPELSKNAELVHFDVCMDI